MIRLLFNYYEDRNNARKKEIDFCLRMNLANPLMKVIILETPGKPQYKQMFDFVNKITGPEDINIIANSDIFFDESIGLTCKMNLNECWALSRWDWYNENSIQFFDRSDSQDCWIFKGPIKPINSTFTLGTLGCDNRIAHDIHQAGYNISNPSRSVKTYHVHNSAVRNYRKTDVVPKPYLTIPTSELI
jgi:hypothetical protein